MWNQSQQPDIVGVLSDVSSTSTGSVLFDAGIGAGLGALMAPASSRLVYAGVGAALGGVLGALGIAVITGYALCKVVRT